MKKLFFGLVVTVALLSVFAPIEVAVGASAMIAGILYFVPSTAGVKSTLPVDVWDAVNATLLRKGNSRNIAPSFLRSFFRTEQVQGLNISFRTKQQGKKVAVDVNIQTKGKYHKRQIGTLTAVQPPMYWEYTDIQEKDYYNGIMADGSATPIDKVYDFASVIEFDFHEIANEFDRAGELQCAQVLNNGILQFNANDNINYGRLVGSMVSVSTAWTVNTTNPLTDISTGVQWIRNNSDNNATEFHAIMGTTAFGAFISNAKIIERQDIRNLKLDDIFRGGLVPSGGAYWGTVTVSSGHTVHIWSYDGYYENASGTKVNYVDVDKVILIPSRSELTYVEADVRLLPGTPNVGTYRGYTTNDFMDFNNQVHYFHIRGRILAVPQEINEIYTMKVTNL